MTTDPDGLIAWRKSSRSTATDTCVELAYDGGVRDSKNPTGPALWIDLSGLLTTARTDQLGRE